MTIVFGTTLKPENQFFSDVVALFAKHMGDKLRLVHVAEDPRAPIVLGTDEEHLLGDVRTRLHQEAERLHALSGAVVQVHLAAGTVADALVSVAEFELATALVVGSRAQRSSHLLGETAERVSRKSSVPVLTLREPDRLASWLQGRHTLRVLIGADLGHAAGAARSFGANLAKLGSCSFEIVYVVSPTEIHKRMGLASSSHTLAPEVEAVLMQELSRVAPATENAAKLRVIPARGSPDAYLVTLAEQENFDLVIVGQRHHSLLEQFWAGSVSRGVVRSSPVSVACVPSALEGVMQPSQPFRNIIVGTDFTKVGDQALAQALGLVAPGGTIHLTYVISGIDAGIDAKEARQIAWSTISKISAPDSAESTCAIQRQILEGSPAEQLLALAERVGANLIVLGMQSRPSVSRTLLGSVARAVAEHARVPVLLVPFGIP